jgi:glutathione synthase/RimK-type ligase-like ATP-grasp enzyme
VRLRLRTQVPHNQAALFIQEHLENMGVTVFRARQGREDVPIINWGIGDERLPGLNTNCGYFNKQTALKRFNNALLRAPEPIAIDVVTEDLKFPVLARKNNHRRGLDVVKCENFEDLQKVLYTHDFVVPYVEKIREYRIYVFRDTVCAGYRKQYTGDGPNNYVIWNHQGGLFRQVCLADDNISDNVREIAIMAVKALRLDFGAVDMMQDKEKQWWVLEVNTAPGIDSLEKKSGIEFAKKFYEWGKEFE